MDNIASVKISNFKVNYKIWNQFIRILTPFTVQWWLFLFLMYCMYLLNAYIIMNLWINIIYIIICLIILFY
jgi:hypothetical protein